MDVGGAIASARAFGLAVAGSAKTAVTGVNSLAKTVNESTGRQKEAFDRLGKIGTVAAVGLVGAFALAVKTTMDFDKQMSAVGAAAGATGGQLQQLRAAALQAGKDTAFSATQAAQGEEELAKAGVSVRDVLGGGLKGALNLAAAGQISVGEAAEVAATAMTQFRLSGSAVPHIADLLSAGANKAQGSVHDLGFALKQSGLVASQFGLSVEDTVGTLSAFASAGLIGSDAGTSFKTMLLSLANPSAKAADLMQQLGINAYDAQGQFVGITNLAGQLHNRLSGLSQAQRDAALATIFGSDAIRAANVLYQQGAGGIQGWINKVNDSGNASRTAAQKMNNLAGDLEQLRGSLETALINAGSGANGALRQLTQTATGAVNVFNSLPAGVQAATIWIAGLSGAAILGAKGIVFLRQTALDARVALEAFGLTSARTAALSGGLRTALAGAAAFMTGPWGIAIAAGVGALAIFAATKHRAAQATQEFTSAIQADSGALGANTRAAVANKLEQEGVLKAAQSLGVNIGTVTDAVLGNKTAYTQVTTALDAYYRQLINAQPANEAERQANLKKLEAIALLRQGLEGQNGAINASVAAAKRQAAATQGTATAQQKAQAAAQQHTSAEQDLARALNDAGSSADDLRKALDGLSKDNIDLEKANIAAARSALQAAKASDKRRGLSLDERDALVQLAQADQDQLVAMKQSGATAGQLTSKLGSQRAAFIRLATSMGISRAAAGAYADKLGLVRASALSTDDSLATLSRERKLKMDIAEWNSKIAAGKRSLASVPASKRAALLATIADLERKVAAAKAKLASIHNKTVYIHGVVYYTQVGATPSHLGGRIMASGGVFGKGLVRKYAEGDLEDLRGAIPATRGIGPTVTNSPIALFGEAGPEAYIPLDPGRRARSTMLLSRVADEFGFALTKKIAASPQRMTMPAGGAGGGRAQAVRVEFAVNGTDQDMKRMIQRMVRVDGRGDVQVAFGKRLGRG
jgi:TP901 family phage tail tape measure protein